jgi:hypothetical protein
MERCATHFALQVPSALSITLKELTCRMLTSGLLFLKEPIFQELIFLKQIFLILTFLKLTLTVARGDNPLLPPNLHWCIESSQSNGAYCQSFDQRFELIGNCSIRIRIPTWCFVWRFDAGGLPLSWAISLCDKWQLRRKIQCLVAGMKATNMMNALGMRRIKNADLPKPPNTCRVNLLLYSDTVKMFGAIEELIPELKATKVTKTSHFGRRYYGREQKVAIASEW